MMKSFLAIISCVLASSMGMASAFAVAPPHGSSPAATKTTRTSSTQLQLYQSVQEAISEAQRICAMDPTSQECKVAWDIVEELEAADSHLAAAAAIPSPTMGADVTAMLSSFDILIQKIDGKMDQLMATTMKLNELGASDPSIEALYVQAEQMKAALVAARQSL